jgi:hypothetical protein
MDGVVRASGDDVHRAALDGRCRRTGHKVAGIDELGLVPAVNWMARVPSEAAADHMAQPYRHVSHPSVRGSAPNLGDELVERLCRERAAAMERLVERDAEAELIAALIDTAGLERFHRHIPRRSGDVGVARRGAVRSVRPEPASALHTHIRVSTLRPTTATWGSRSEFASM